MPSFTSRVKPDWESFIKCVRREAEPKRVHYVELFLDEEIKQQVVSTFGLDKKLSPNDPYFSFQREIAIQRYLGYDYIWCNVEGLSWTYPKVSAEDTAEAKKKGGNRNFTDSQHGAIANWDDFEKYPWPDPEKYTTRGLEWLTKNLPDDMCVIGGQLGHYAELLSWLLGYEPLCFMLFDNTDLVQAVMDKVMAIEQKAIDILLQFERVKIIWGSDDMGFKTGTLISPKDLRRFVLPGHKALAKKTHAAGRTYFLHSCGQLEKIMDDLIDDVGVDAKHSFEDVITPVEEMKKRYGKRVSLLGGVDVDLLCRADEKTIRERVRSMIAVCQPGGGWCLGTGNTVANYIPLNNYLAMMDEGANYR